MVPAAARPVGAPLLLLLVLATTSSALRLHRVSVRPNGDARLLARRDALALGLASGLAVSQSATADTPPPTAARGASATCEQGACSRKANRQKTGEGANEYVRESNVRET